MAQLQFEFSEQGLGRVLEVIQDSSKFETEPGDWVKLGALRLKLKRAEGRFENGKFEVIDPAIGGPRGLIKELDLLWEVLDIEVGINIDPVSVGGFCIIPTPWGCALRAPKKTFFKSDPDVSATLALGGLRHEVSAAFDLETKKRSANWEVLLKPQSPIDIDFVDLADMVGDILDRLIKNFVKQALGFLPGWARDLVEAILGAFADLIRRLLDLADDVMEWIEKKIGISLGLIDIAISIFFEFFYKGTPIYEMPLRFELMPPDQSGPAVTAPVTNLSAAFAMNPGRAVFAVDLG